MMEPNPERCAHCDSPIVDPTTRRVHGDSVFCCANCSAAMEGAGLGSGNQTRRQEGTLLCAHCDCPIVDESSMESRGDAAFCCRNCAQAMGTMPMESGQRGAGI